MAGTDWKSALAALGTVEESTPTAQPNEVERKKRVGITYSTDPHFAYTEGAEEHTTTLPKAQQRLRLSMERAGRGGKTVTLVKNFVGSTEDANALCKYLKQQCGVGGSVKDGDIVIQGDHRGRLLELLKREGYTQTK